MDALSTAILPLRLIFGQPDVQAALIAALIASIKYIKRPAPRPPRMWLDVPLCAILGYVIVPLTQALLPVFGLTDEASLARAVGAAVGLYGVDSMERILDRIAARFLGPGPKDKRDK